MMPRDPHSPAELRLMAARHLEWWVARATAAVLQCQSLVYQLPVQFIE